MSVLTASNEELLWRRPQERRGSRISKPNYRDVSDSVYFRAKNPNIKGIPIEAKEINRTLIQIIDSNLPDSIGGSPLDVFQFPNETNFAYHLEHNTHIHGHPIKRLILFDNISNIKKLYSEHSYDIDNFIFCNSTPGHGINISDFYSPKGDKTETRIKQLLIKTFEKVKDVLEYSHGWDGEEGQPVNRTSWDRAIDFLDTYTKYIHKEYDRIISMPDVDNVGDGSIYLSWSNSVAELSIKFKAIEEYEVHYYGDLFGNTQVIKSILRKNDIDEVLAFWMKENLYESISD